MKWPPTRWWIFMGLTWALMFVGSLLLEPATWRQSIGASLVGVSGLTFPNRWHNSWRD